MDTFGRPEAYASLPRLIFKDEGRKGNKRRAPRQSLEHSAPPQDAMRVRLDRGRPVASDYISGSIQNGYVRAEVLAAKGA